MSNILAIETATPACSVALSVHAHCDEHYEITPRGHAAMVLPTIQALLNQNQCTLQDIEVFAFGRGPGSFTGNRIAASVIQGLAFGCKRPVAAVSTLQALAQGAYRLYGVDSVLCGIDARKSQIYWGVYRLEAGVMQPCGDEQLSNPDEIAVPKHVSLAVGQAWQNYETECQTLLEKMKVAEDLPYPHAQDLIPMAQEMQKQGQLVSAESAIPCYIRNQVTG